MFNWIKEKAKKFKNWIIFFVLGTGVVLAAGEIISNEIPVNLQLKCNKDKIIESREVDWIIQKEDGTFENRGKIKNYDYISNIKVENAGYKFKTGEQYSNVRKIIKTGNKTTLDLFVGDHYFKDENGDVFEIEQGATTTIEAFNELTKDTIIDEISKLFIKKALAVDYYAGAGDGIVVSPDSSSWDTIHDGATGNGVYATNAEDNLYIYKGTNYTLHRFFFPIDTSALPDTATIDSATFYAYNREKAATDTQTSYHYFRLVKTFQASNTTLGVDDFNDCGYDSGNETSGRAQYLPVAGAPDKTYASVTAGAYNNYILNATGRGWISKTGYTKLGVRSGLDCDDVPVQQDKNLYLRHYNSEETGTDKDPYISITYTEGGGGEVEKKKADQQTMIDY
ncbi:hypothetical protein KAJ89_04070 [Candidatus Parcubacteria bacterium]|nr:hypothetical protein [Candidatus Parcubacteria bacterium]